MSPSLCQQFIKKDLRWYNPTTKLPKECNTKCRLYHYKECCDVSSDFETGDGIFSGISSLVSFAIKLISTDKDIITFAAKRATAIGGLAAVANQVAQAKIELKQIKAI